VAKKPRLLWVGDAVATTGFARITHQVLARLDAWDVVVLGLNYNGDPHPYPYPIYPCYPGGDAFGVRRVARMVEVWKPDVVLVQQDPWNVAPYVDEIRTVDRFVPIVGAIAVDGRNCQVDALADLALTIFWTDFAVDEAHKAGARGPRAVVPLGVDLDVYHPVDAAEARTALDFKGAGVPIDLADAFIVGNVNRNQPRKRLDLTIAYFAEWVASAGVEDAYLFLHVAPTGEAGCDVKQLMRYYGLQGRLILAEPPVGTGVSEAALRATYGCFSVQLTTTQGEGFGLPTLEGMACGVPQIVPDWAALGDWPGDAVLKVPCTTCAVTPGGINVVGGIADRDATIGALDQLYRNPGLRAAYGVAGRAWAARPEYRWDDIGRRYDLLLSTVHHVQREVARAD
jgi:D-inositol-3-phosphate glycosyltransferase